MDVHHDTVVIGAGLAGLAIAEALRAKGEPDVVVLEAAPRERVGGRVRSRYGDDRALEYEAGRWRVPRGHARVRRLFERHGLPLVPLRTPAPHTRAPRASPVSGLAAYDVNLLQTNDPVRADARDQHTGYADETFAESSTAPYFSEDTEYYVCPQGFSRLPEAMARRLDVRYDTRVVDIRRVPGGTEVACRARDGGRFSSFGVRARRVFVCIPPGVALRFPSFAQRMQSHLHRVEAGCLHHVYVAGRLPGPPRHVVDATSPLVQTVSDQYGSGWFQASYTGGRVARFWHHLALAFPAFLRSLLTRELRGRFGAVLADAPPRSHFWEVAYHLWRPVPCFDLRDAVACSAYPNPVRFPDLFWAGEAFSSHQGWMEGALETAELALAAAERGSCLSVRPCGPDELVAEGRVLGNLDAWARVHPGGAGAIHKYKGQAIDDLLLHVQHSAHAWAVVAALQTAWDADGSA